ncbi:aspartate kinase [Enterococcus sp. HY326]|uniref:aspartate kinase n=1 Tax=Enterococcus sp. HY326 TaxID=2971265 RepID=UPI00223F813D|nr:aspartate kinase [Enterococcus sp. HY326]
MKVIKFGGSSLASAKQLKKVLNIVSSDPERRFVVVSAPGKREGDDIKVTDMLIAYYDTYASGGDTAEICGDIIERYKSNTDALGITAIILPEIENNLRGLAQLPIENNRHLRDAFLASGENNNAKLVAAYFAHEGLPARYINPKELGMFVSDEPGNARILKDSFAKIYQNRDSAEILVVPGFFGYTEDGEICTFSRGGSDISGAIVAAGMQADLYENFTDVDGIFAAHPGLIHNPELIEELTFKEMRELAYAGFKVFHDEALHPAYTFNVPVVIKNTNNPSAKGTFIRKNREINHQPVVGIASDSGFSSLYITKHLMNREVGFVRRILEIFEDLNISFEHMPSGIDDVSIIIRDRYLTPEKETLLIEKIQEKLEPDEVHITHGLSLIMVVGEGMRQKIGIMAKSANSFANKEVNLEMINQGSSEVSIMFGIKSEHEARAIRSLYYTFFD